LASPDQTTPRSRQFIYNQANRLSEYIEDGETVARYTYNALGQRSRKELDAATTLFHYAGTQLLSETDGAGNTEKEYIWLGTRPISQIESNGLLTYLHTDHLLTPRIGTSDAQIKVWSWEGEAFGEAHAQGPIEVNLRFPGQYFYSETGQHYNYFRDYAPGHGRYVQSDPIGLSAGVNLYVYAASNTHRFLDPFGLKERPVFDLEISLGLQAGVSGGKGALSFAGALDLGSFRMRTSDPATRITQGATASVGTDRFEFGLRAQRSGDQMRLIGHASDFVRIPAETLRGVPFEIDPLLSPPYSSDSKF